MLEAAKSRLDILAQAKKLPTGMDKAALAKAQGGPWRPSSPGLDRRRPSSTRRATGAGPSRRRRALKAQGDGPPEGDRPAVDRGVDDGRSREVRDSSLPG